MKKLILSTLFAASIIANAHADQTFTIYEVSGMMMAASVCEGLMARRGHSRAADIWASASIELEDSLSGKLPAETLTKMRQDGFNMGFQESVPEEAGVTIDNLVKECKEAADTIE